MLDSMVVGRFKYPNTGITGINIAMMQAASYFGGKFTIAKLKFQVKYHNHTDLTNIFLTRPANADLSTNIPILVPSHRNITPPPKS